MPGGLLVVAGEASADLHASHVVTALRARRSDLPIGGVGGALCRAAGMDVVVDCAELSVMGITEVLASWSRIRRSFDAVLAWVDEHKPRAALLIDFAGFNLRLARELKQRGVPVVYFISPKVWAWGKGRIPTMRRLIDRLLVIFPFEVDFFRRHGIHAEYVGNPTLDQLALPPSREEGRVALALAPAGRVVALLPGSRASEIRRHMGLMIEAARRVVALHPGTRFLLPRASTVSPSLLAAHVERARAAGVDLQVVEGRAPEVAAAADAAIVASGTATLETALVGTPMVVVYKTSFISGLFVYLFVRIPWASPVNILVNRGVVPEFLQFRATVGNVAAALSRLLAPAGGDQQRRDFAELRALLGAPGAPGRVADAILQVVDGTWRPPTG